MSDPNEGYYGNKEGNLSASGEYRHERSESVSDGTHETTDTYSASGTVGDVTLTGEVTRTESRSGSGESTSWEGSASLDY